MWGEHLRKELRQLLPWALLVFGGLFALLLLWLVFSPLDSFGWASLTPLFEPTLSKTWNATLLFWAVLFAYAGFPREHDDGTLAFLFSLPASRTRIFLAKVVAAGLLLSVAVVWVELVRWLCHLLNPESFDGHTFRLRWALTSLGLSLAAAWISLGYATFLAVFRRFGLLLAAVIGTLLIVLSERRPALRQLNPLELTHVEFFYSTPLLPYRTLLGHASSAAVLAAIAGWVWVGREGRFSNSLSRILEKAWVRWLFVVSVVVTFGVVCVQISKQFDTEDETFGSLQEFSGAAKELSTRRYQFRFPGNMQPRVESLAKVADPLHDRVSDYLGAGPGDSIAVNLLKPSSTHAGTATWNTIRMDARSVYDELALSRTLAHETTHVLSLRISDRRLESHAATLRFLDEGLAEYVALRLLPDSGRTRGYWLESALLRARERVELSSLLDFPELVRRFGEPAIYPLGFTWVSELVRNCGEDAPKRVLAAVARPEVPLELSGEPLLRTVLQLARCDSSQVISAWGKALDAVASERKPEVESVPTLVGNVRETADEEFVVHAALEGKPLPDAIYRVVIRGRSSDTIEDQFIVSAALDKSGELAFEVPEHYVVDRAVDFQFVVAWRSEGVLLQHAQEWRHARVSP